MQNTEEKRDRRGTVHPPETFLLVFVFNGHSSPLRYLGAVAVAYWAFGVEVDSSPTARKRNSASVVVRS